MSGNEIEQAEAEANQQTGHVRFSMHTATVSADPQTCVSSYVSSQVQPANAESASTFRKCVVGVRLSTGTGGVRGIIGKSVFPHQAGAGGLKFRFACMMRY